MCSNCGILDKIRKFLNVVGESSLCKEPHVVGESSLCKEPHVVYNGANNLESHGICNRSRTSGKSKEDEGFRICTLHGP